MITNKIKPYALALFELSKETNKLEKIYQDSRMLCKCLPIEYLEILQSNFLNKSERHQLLKKSLDKKIDKLFFNFLMYLVDKNIIYALIDILEHFKYLYNDFSGIKFANVYSIEPLSKKVLAKIEKLLKIKFGKKFIIYQHLDKSLIGGFRIQIEDEVLDYSVKNNLMNLKKEFLEVDYGK